MKVLRMRSWNFHADNLERNDALLSKRIGRGGAYPAHRGRRQSQSLAGR